MSDSSFESPRVGQSSRVFLDKGTRYLIIAGGPILKPAAVCNDVPLG